MKQSFSSKLGDTLAEIPVDYSVIKAGWLPKYTKKICELIGKEVIGSNDDMRPIEKGKDYEIYDGDGKSVKERNALRNEQRRMLR